MVMCMVAYVFLAIEWLRWWSCGWWSPNGKAKIGLITDAFEIMYVVMSKKVVMWCGQGDLAIM